MIGRFIQALTRGDDEVDYRLVEGECCVSKDHTSPELATRLAHMVQGPTCYCDACAARAKQVYDALGTHLHIEVLDVKVIDHGTTQDSDRGARQIDLGGD